MEGVLYTIDKLGRALAQAEQENVTLRSALAEAQGRLAELEGEHASPASIRPAAS